MTAPLLWTVAHQEEILASLSPTPFHHYYNYYYYFPHLEMSHPHHTDRSDLFMPPSARWSRDSLYYVKFKF